MQLIVSRRDAEDCPFEMIGKNRMSGTQAAESMVGNAGIVSSDLINIHLKGVLT